MITKHSAHVMYVVVIIAISILAIPNNILKLNFFFTSALMPNVDASRRNENASHYLMLFENENLDGNFFHVKPFLKWPEGVLTNLDGYENLVSKLVCLKGAWIFYSGKYLSGDGNEMIYSQEKTCYKLNMRRNLSSVRYIPISLNDEKTTVPDKILIFRRSYLQSYFGEERIFTYDDIFEKDRKFMRSHENQFEFPTVLDIFYMYHGDFSQIVITGAENTSWTLYDQPEFGARRTSDSILSNNAALTSVCIKHGLISNNPDSKKYSRNQNQNANTNNIISFSTSLFKFTIRSVRKGCHSSNVTFLNRAFPAVSKSNKTCTKSKIRLSNLVGSLQSKEHNVLLDKTKTELKFEIKNRTVVLDQLLNLMQKIFNKVCAGPGHNGKWIHKPLLSNLLNQFILKYQHAHIFLSSVYSKSMEDLESCSKKINSNSIPLFSNGRENTNSDEISGFLDHHGNQIVLEIPDFMETVELMNTLDPAFEAVWFLLSINLGVCSSLSSSSVSSGNTTQKYFGFYQKFVNYFLKPLRALWIQKPECGVKNSSYKTSFKTKERRMLDNMKLCNAAVYMRSRSSLKKPVRPIDFQWQGELIGNTILVPRVIQRNIIIPR